MEYTNQADIRRNYKTFKEAFEALPLATRQHSVRVAAYTRELFIQAMAIEMRMGSAEAEARLQPEYERGAYLAGLYHDIGKVLIPVEYHVEHADDDETEQALYRKHVTGGVQLAEQMVFGEELADIEKKMIREAIAFHHQRPGAGFPLGPKRERDIPLMALLAGFADYVDHKVTGIRSETPFEDGVEQIKGFLDNDNAETELELLLQEGYAGLRRVFVKYQEQSLKIPTITPFVKRKVGRPFELKYRPVVDRRRKQTVGLQAKMYFKDAKDIYVEYEDVKTILNKQNINAEVVRYFLYEAGDTLMRADVCELSVDYIAFEPMPKFFTLNKIAAMVVQQAQDMRLPLGRLLLVLDEDWFMEPSKAFITNLERLTKAGVPLMLVNWSGRYIKTDEIQEYSIKKVALAPEVYDTLGEDATVTSLRALQEHGVELIAGELSKTKYNGMLNALDITAMTGPLAGGYLTEDETIKSELSLRA